MMPALNVNPFSLGYARRAVFPKHAYDFVSTSPLDAKVLSEIKPPEKELPSYVDGNYRPPGIQLLRAIGECSFSVASKLSRGNLQQNIVTFYNGNIPSIETLLERYKTVKTVSQAIIPDKGIRKQSAVQQLAELYAQTKDPVVRDIVLASCSKSLELTAREYYWKLPKSARRTVSLQDYVNEAAVGALQALEKYDPHRGVLFSTYCERRMTGAIQDSQRCEDEFSRTMREAINKIDSASERLRLKGRNNPSVDELSEEAGIPTKSVEEALILKGKKEFSLDDNGVRKDCLNNNGRMESIIQDKTVTLADDYLLKIEELEQFARAAEYLEQRHQTILYHRLNGLNLKQIGDLFDISESRVSQLMGDIIEEIRERLKVF